MPTALGSLPESKIYLGSNEIDASYLGGNLVFSEQDLLITFDTDIITNQFGQSTVSVSFDSAANYSGLIEWGDGSSDEVLSGTGNTGITHIFGGTEIIVQVRVSGSSVPKFVVQGSSNIISVENLGNVGLIQTGNMFNACTNLASVKIGNNLNTLNNNTFYSCTSLTSIIIPHNVTTIGIRQFELCSSLVSVNLPYNITNLGYRTFKGCTSLTSITIPNSVTSIGNELFYDCGNLATVDLSLPKSVIDAAFSTFLNTASPLTLNVPTGTTGWTAGTGQSIGGNTNVTVNLV